MPFDKYFFRRFLIADDHPLIRAAMKTIIKEAYPDAVIEESVDGNDVIGRITVGKYDIIILDIQMPNCETLSLIKHIHLNYPKIAILVYSMAAENIFALRVLKAGARGFISKESSVADLKKAIALALAGRKYFSKEVAELLTEEPRSKLASPFATLSARELQVAGLLLAGNTIKRISTVLVLHNSTTSTHKAAIYQKLKVTNLLELKALSDTYQV